MRFTKVEGLSNDFIILDLREDPIEALAQTVAWAREHAPRVCDRRRGVGADGILVVGGPRGGARASMTVVNFDGSRPEMCGNGLRCVAAHVAAHALGGRGTQTEFTVDTDAGLRPCAVLVSDGETQGKTQVRVDMGPATITGEVALTIADEDRPRTFVSVDVGNPHAIHFVNGQGGEEPEALARSLGPSVELSPCFAPAKTNVEFARLEVDGSLTLWVWERGVGITQACGTGACATAAAAMHVGLIAADVPVRVCLPGGALEIAKTSAATLLMTGPAREVFRGEL